MLCASSGASAFQIQVPSLSPPVSVSTWYNCDDQFWFFHWYQPPFCACSSGSCAGSIGPGKQGIFFHVWKECVFDNACFWPCELGVSRHLVVKRTSRNSKCGCYGAFLNTTLRNLACQNRIFSLHFNHLAFHGWKLCSHSTSKLGICQQDFKIKNSTQGIFLLDFCATPIYNLSKVVIA